MVWGRKKKKGAGPSSEEDTPMSPTTPRETILTSRASFVFSRLITPRSHKQGRKQTASHIVTDPGLPFSTTTSPVSAADDMLPPAFAIDSAQDDFDSFSEKTHHSVTSFPVLSPVMAAIEARTFEMDRRANMSKSIDSPLADAGSSSSPSDRAGAPDRPEKKRTPRALQSFLSRWDTSSSSNHATDLSENWLINFNDLVVGKTIGHSSFGMVNQGKLNGTKVAVKTIHCDSSPNAPNNLAAFKTEAELNCKLRHPNIVLFMGISLQPTKVCIVTELMSRGNVRDLLVGIVKGESVRLDWCLRQQWALDTARGMAYLHSLEPPMIHRDLKTTNLLVDRGMNVKICDFGLSRFRSDKLMSAVGTVHFAAPEVLRNELYTEKADLFSFGTVMWELYTRECVFEGMAQLHVFQAVVNGNMPEVNEGCDERYGALLQQCWSLDPTERPTFCEVIDRLSVLVEEYDSP